MRTAAVLPIKSFAEAKQRLRDDMSPHDRRALVEAMYADALVALGRVHALERIVVVSGDRVAQRIAGGYGATVIEDDEPGHNAAAMNGIRALLEDEVERALLVPGDCPLLSPDDLNALLSHPAGERSALIVPDRHGTGTNALLLTPPDVLTPSFGPDSRRRHEANASAAGIEAEVVELDSLALDVDTPDDLEALRRMLAGTRGGAAHTRGMLSQLLRAQTT
jgi:2-phospho-L-lactate/phosphoenolpyruvate guanylyltransferase